MRAAGVLLMLIGVACIFRGAWVLTHPVDHAVTQWTLLGLSGMFLGALGGFLWERGKK